MRKKQLYTLLGRVFLLLFIVTIANSCKKDIITPKSPPTGINGKLQGITYNDFLGSVNVNKLGSLKQMLQQASSGNKIMSANGDNGIGQLSVYTNNIKRLIANRDTSYVFSMGLTSPRAASFSNLTIQVNQGKTFAFITTYTPNREWIIARREKKDIEFKGTITFANVDLANVNLSYSLAISKTTSKEKVMGIGSKLMYLQPACTTYDIYQNVPYGCSDGEHMPGDPNCWAEDAVIPPGDYRGGYRLVKTGSYTECDSGGGDTGGGNTGGNTGGGTGSGNQGGGSGGNNNNGGTTPNPPDPYNPCEGYVQTPGAPANICDTPPIGELPYNEFDPIYIPSNFEITDYPEEWAANEDEFANATALILQEGINKFDPVPEMYYITSTPVDMTGATHIQGYTVKGAPRSYTYFWKKLAQLRPEMFSEKNRNHLKANQAPYVDAQWIKYNPTHAPYDKVKLIHHHDQQGFIAYAIPEKVHKKWHARLHAYRTGGKISGIRGKLLSLAGVMHSVFTQFTGFATGDPDAWINWFGGMNQVGKIYYHADKGVYFQITNKIETKDSNGRVTRAKVNYDVYESYVWDEDEGKYMGLVKLGSFYEDIDVVNRTSYNAGFEKT